MRKLWVYKCNVNADAKGNWDRFFKDLGGQGRWGGTRSTTNLMSLRFIREELSKGDLVLAWQVDRAEAVGLCKIRELKHSGDEVWIVLTTILPFSRPVKLLKFKKTTRALADGLAFVQGKQGTLYNTTPGEARAILRRCGCATKLLERT